MAKYIFKLKDSYIPDLTQVTDNDKKYGGVRLTYTIKLVHSFSLFGVMNIPYRIETLGVKTFLRPYKKYWDKHRYRLPYAYWGKVSNKLVRLWITLKDDWITGSKIDPEASLMYSTVEIFGHVFNSKQLASYLYCKSRKFSIIK